MTNTDPSLMYAAAVLSSFQMIGWSSDGSGTTNWLPVSKSTNCQASAVAVVSFLMSAAPPSGEIVPLSRGDRPAQRTGLA